MIMSHSCCVRGFAGYNASRSFTILLVLIQLGVVRKYLTDLLARGIMKLL